MIKNLLRSASLATVFMAMTSAAGYAQSASGASVPVSVEIKGSGSGFTTLDTRLFKIKFVESLERKSVYLYIF